MSSLATISPQSYYQESIYLEIEGFGVNLVLEYFINAGDYIFIFDKIWRVYKFDKNKIVLLRKKQHEKLIIKDEELSRFKGYLKVISPWFFSHIEDPNVLERNCDIVTTLKQESNRFLESVKLNI